MRSWWLSRFDGRRSLECRFYTEPIRGRNRDRVVPLLLSLDQSERENACSFCMSGNLTPFSCLLFQRRTVVSKETPLDDPRQQSDRGSHKQTDKPWNGNPEKEQRPGG